MKISIVTVVRNDAEHIEETMRSVLEQKGSFDIEYIVIDGASSDGTVEIIRKYASCLAAFISEPDSGIYDAMNKGIRLTHGEVVGMINSGDHYLPGAFEKVAAAFTENGVENRIFWGDVIYEHVGRVRGFRPRKVKIGAFAPHPSMFVPKAVYDSIGLYDTSLRLMGDYDFMYRAVNVKKIVPLYLQEPIAFYREGGLSDRMVGKCLKEELQVKLRYGQNPLIAKLIYALKLFRNRRRLGEA